MYRQKIDKEIVKIIMNEYFFSSEKLVHDEPIVPVCYYSFVKSVRVVLF